MSSQHPIRAVYLVLIFLFLTMLTRCWLEPGAELPPPTQVSQQTPAPKEQSLREGEKKLDEHVNVVGDVLAAAATNATQVMRTLDHHANLLAILYGVAAGILVFGGIAAGWIGVGQFDRLKNDLRQSLETECRAMRRELDLAREQVGDMLSWHRDARKRVEQRIDMWDTRFKQIEVTASLSAKHSECYALGVIYDAVVQRGNNTESSVQSTGGSEEVPPALRSSLERIIRISSHCLTQVSAHGQG